MADSPKREKGASKLGGKTKAGSRRSKTPMWKTIKQGNAPF
jgi:hypothetical protein